jgi:hypothetical protein
VVERVPFRALVSEGSVSKLWCSATGALVSEGSVRERWCSATGGLVRRLARTVGWGVWLLGHRPGRSVRTIDTPRPGPLIRGRGLRSPSIQSIHSIFDSFRSFIPFIHLFIPFIHSVHSFQAYVNHSFRSFIPFILFIPFIHSVHSFQELRSELFTYPLMCYRATLLME